MTFNKGIQIEQLSGISTGHRELLDWIDGWLEREGGVTRASESLYISSPIGLGHARRDVAIAQELRKLVRRIEIDWLAQDPVTRVLEARGREHPPDERAAGQRVALTSSPSRPSTTCTASRPGGGWTRS